MHTFPGPEPGNANPLARKGTNLIDGSNINFSIEA
jgi:hypothetical protein